MREVTQIHKPITELEHQLGLWCGYLLAALKKGGPVAFKAELKLFQKATIRSHTKTLGNKGLLKEVTTNE